MNEWPGVDTERMKFAKHALVECFDGKMSPGGARTAFIEAANQADISIEAAQRPLSTGKRQRWTKQ
jgi:hypothetical protein